MKTPEINIVKKMSDEHKKILFIAPIAIIIIIVIAYILFNPSSKSKQGTTVESAKWDLPQDSKSKLPNSTIGIHNEFEKHNKKTENDANRDYFGALDNNLEDSKNTNTSPSSLSSKDSMYLEVQKQLRQLEEKKATRSMPTNSNTSRSRNNNKSRTVTSPVEAENDIDIQDFFNKKASKTIVKENKLASTDATIYAVIHNDQNVKNNGRITLRLTKPATINNINYKPNTFVYGFARFSKNRVNVSIENINHNAVDLVAYDSQDGSPGLYIEGANSLGEISKESKDDGINEVDLNGVPLGNTVGNTVKSILKKKNKEVNVFLLNDYEVLLKPSK